MQTLEVQELKKKDGSVCTKLSLIITVIKWCSLLDHLIHWLYKGFTCLFSGSFLWRFGLLRLTLYDRDYGFTAPESGFHGGEGRGALKFPRQN